MTADTQNPTWAGVIRLLSGSSFVFGCRIAGAAITFLTQILLARWLGAAELGYYAIAYSWMILLAAVPSAGFTTAAVRFIGQGLADNDHGYAWGFIRHSKRVTVISGAVVLITGSVIVALSPGISPELRNLTLAATIAIPFFAVIRMDSGIAMASARFALGYLPGTVVRPLLFLIALIVFWDTGGIVTADSAMVVHTVSIIVIAIPTTLLTRHAMRRMLSTADPVKDNSRWNKAAISLLGVALLTNYFQQITVAVTGFFLPSAEIGIYNVSYRIAMLISFGLLAIDAFVAPSIARFYRNGERAELVEEVQRATALRFLMALLAVIGLALIGDRVLAFFGEEFVSGHAIMVILAMGQLSLAAVGPVVRILAVSGHHKYSLYASVVTVIAWLLVTAILAPFYGILGVSIAVFLSLTAWAAMQRHFVRRFVGIDCLVVVRDLGNPVRP